jgi:hypothetical protein
MTSLMEENKVDKNELAKMMQEKSQLIKDRLTNSASASASPPVMTITAEIGTSTIGFGATGQIVKDIQQALFDRGFRMTIDGYFGPGTQAVVERFQTQHGLTVDGTVGPLTAALLDAPATQVVAAAKPAIVPMVPLVPASGWPHDDTASLLAFYGKPWEDASLLTSIAPPFAMTYKEDSGVLVSIKSIRIHKKCAAALSAVLATCWEFYGHDQTAINATSIVHFSGSFNPRPIAGSSRISDHSFGAAVDFDAEHNSFYFPPAAPHFTMSTDIAWIFKKNGAFWGNEFKQRRDPMHFQWAHE